MNELYERTILGAIQYHKLIGDHKKYQELQDEYNRRVLFDERSINTNQFFEGIMVAVGWDKLNTVNQSSLFTQEDEDILLEHRFGMWKLKPYLNQKVKIWGSIISNKRDGRRVLVKKIIRIMDRIKEPLAPLTNNLLMPR